MNNARLAVLHMFDKEDDECIECNQKLRCLTGSSKCQILYATNINTSYRRRLDKWLFE